MQGDVLKCRPDQKSPPRTMLQRLSLSKGQSAIKCPLPALHLFSHLFCINSRCLIARSFPGGTSVKEPACHCRRPKKHRFDPWVGKIPWRRAGQKCAHCPSAGLSDAFLLFFWACGFVGGRPQREIALLITSCQGCSLNTTPPVPLVT